MFGLDPQARRRDESKGRYDPVLIVVAIALASQGVVMVASSSIEVAEGQHVGRLHYLFRHLVFLGLGGNGLGPSQHLPGVEHLLFDPAKPTGDVGFAVGEGAGSGGRRGPHGAGQGFNPADVADVDVRGQAVSVRDISRRPPPCD